MYIPKGSEDGMIVVETRSTRKVFRIFKVGSSVLRVDASGRVKHGDETIGMKELQIPCMLHFPRELKYSSKLTVILTTIRGTSTGGICLLP